MNLAQAQTLQDELDAYLGLKIVRIHDGPKGYLLRASLNDMAYGADIRDAAQVAPLRTWLKKYGVRKAEVQA